MVKMAIFVGVGRTDECSNNKREEEKKWKLLSEIKLTANNPRILIKQNSKKRRIRTSR